MANNVKYAKTDQPLSRLNSEQYRVTQQDGTEAPFSGECVDNKASGIYVDVVRATLIALRSITAFQEEDGSWHRRRRGSLGAASSRQSP